jgi:hypothetical protein
MATVFTALHAGMTTTICLPGISHLVSGPRPESVTFMNLLLLHWFASHFPVRLVSFGRQGFSTPFCAPITFFFRERGQKVILPLGLFFHSPSLDLDVL